MKQAKPRAGTGRRAREAARRRAELLEVAGEMFAAKGYQGTRISAIARAAEVSLATVYAIFQSKEELFQAVNARAARSIRDTVQAQVDAIDDPGERLLALVECLLRCFDENGALMRIYTLGTHGLPWSIRQKLGEPMVEVYREFLEYVRELARAAARAGRLGDLDPEAVALAIAGTVNATSAEWIESGRSEPVSAAAPAIRAIVKRLLSEARAS